MNKSFLFYSEEEQLYVKFAQNITKDVLNSGICSDK